jgi:hypothetical protein
MASLGQVLIRRLVDTDLEGNGGWFKGMAWRVAGNEELVEFAERFMGGS